MESVATPGEKKPPADPITDRYLQERALFLDDWAKTVQPHQDALEAYVGHAVTYASGALQASYILNGGALAALPALLTAMNGASIAQIATAAIPFVVGIVSTAVSSLTAYLNFNWNAEIERYDFYETAENATSFYHRRPKKALDPNDREKLRKRVGVTYWISLLAGVVALIAFIVGSVRFIELARNSTVRASHTITEPQKG